MSILHPTSPAIEYPEGDGKPMAETEFHFWNMLWLAQILDAWYAGDPNTYVGGNMMMYYEEGKPKRHVAPDIFVVHGVPKRPRRRTFKIWEEGKGPDTVIELTSRGTRKTDEGEKLRIYRDIIHVREYILFDPHGEYLDPRLRGFRLQNGVYVPIEPVAGRLPCETLDLHLEVDDWTLRPFDPKAGERLAMPEEVAQRAQQEAQRAESEAQRAESEAQRAEREAEHARREAERAEREAERARQADAENERLRRELEELRRQRGGNGSGS